MINKNNIPEPTYMLYRYPGDKFIHGDYFSTKIVKESELSVALDGEWFLTSAESKGAINNKKDTEVIIENKEEFKNEKEHSEQEGHDKEKGSEHIDEEEKEVLNASNVKNRRGRPRREK